MNRVESFHYRWEALACALQNSFAKRVDRQRFVHNPNVSYKVGHVLIGYVTGKPEPVNGPQSLDPPQTAAKSPLPLAPDLDRIWFPEQNPKNHRCIDVDRHLRRRSSRSVCTPEIERRDLMPSIFLRSFTGREGPVT